MGSYLIWYENSPTRLNFLCHFCNPADIRGTCEFKRNGLCSSYQHFGIVQNSLRLCLSVNNVEVYCEVSERLSACVTQYAQFQLSSCCINVKLTAYPTEQRLQLISVDGIDLRLFNFNFYYYYY